MIAQDQRIFDRIMGLIDSGNAVLSTQHWANAGQADYIGSTMSVVRAGDFAGWRAQCLSLLTLAFGAKAHYTTAYADATKLSTSDATSAGLNVLTALSKDMAEGFMSSVVEDAHADVFTDFLDMADHLIQENSAYKDPAAVLAGGVLEGHLKKLAQKHGIDTVIKKPKGDEPKTGQRLNDDLSGAGHLSKNDQKSVTAWLAIRNDAAHANYGNYNKDQVAFLIMQLRDFIARNPA